ncbi:MAG: YceI family protein [Acidobacteriota bacterium]|nr:YceI family protein [Acidobacteriota bacterium]
MIFRKNSCLFAAAALVAFLVPAATPASGADTYSIDPAHSSVVFKVRHLLTKVHGTFDGFEGTIVRDAEMPAHSSVRFTIETASINTANGDRDDHLRASDFFDAEKFPTIEFESTSVEATGDGEYQVTGLLNMHGVAREIVLPVRFLGEMSFRGGLRAGFETSITLDRKQWGISWNRALDQGGAILGDDVLIEINLETVKQQEEQEAAE